MPPLRKTKTKQKNWRNVVFGLFLTPFAIIVFLLLLVVGIPSLPHSVANTPKANAYTPFLNDVQVTNVSVTCNNKTTPCGIHTGDKLVINATVNGSSNDELAFTAAAVYPGLGVPRVTSLWHQRTDFYTPTINVPKQIHWTTSAFYPDPSNPEVDVFLGVYDASKSQMMWSSYEDMMFH